MQALSMNYTYAYVYFIYLDSDVNLKYTKIENIVNKTTAAATDTGMIGTTASTTAISATTILLLVAISTTKLLREK